MENKTVNSLHFWLTTLVEFAMQYPVNPLLVCIEKINSLLRFLTRTWMENYIWVTRFLLQSVRWVIVMLLFS